MDFVTAIKTCFSKYADFNGRARRSEFWFFYLLTFVVGWIPYIGWLASVALIIPSFSVGARRLHDTGRSGWWQLLSLIPVIGTIVLIIWWASEGTPGANEYGENPKGL